MNADQLSLTHQPGQDVAVIRAELISHGWRPAVITDQSIAAMLTHFPNPAHALAAWESIANGKPYKPKEHR